MTNMIRHTFSVTKRYYKVIHFTNRITVLSNSFHNVEIFLNIQHRKQTNKILIYKFHFINDDSTTLIKKYLASSISTKYQHFSPRKIYKYNVRHNSNMHVETLFGIRNSKRVYSCHVTYIPTLYLPPRVSRRNENEETKIYCNAAGGFPQCARLRKNLRRVKEKDCKFVSYN